MSVIKSKSDPANHILEGEGTECFMCLNDCTEPPFILWSGLSPIRMHMNCAKRLSGAILRDVREMEEDKESADDWYHEVKKQFPDLYK